MTANGRTQQASEAQADDAQGEEQGHRDESARGFFARRVKRGNLHPEQHQI